MLLDEPLRQLVFGRSLNFCSCTTWFLDFDDSVRINRAWLYKDLKVLALQAIASVAHQGACWTWNLRAWALFPLGVTFCYWTFWFSHSKDENATIGISVCMWKTLIRVLRTCDLLQKISQLRYERSEQSRFSKSNKIHMIIPMSVGMWNSYLLVRVLDYSIGFSRNYTKLAMLTFLYWFN